MTQRQLAEKCDEPGCLNISPSDEWLPLLLLNQRHGQLLQQYYCIIISAAASAENVQDGAEKSGTRGALSADTSVSFQQISGKYKFMITFIHYRLRTLDSQ